MFAASTNSPENSQEERRLVAGYRRAAASHQRARARGHHGDRVNANQPAALATWVAGSLDSFGFARTPEYLVENKTQISLLPICPEMAATH